MGSDVGECPICMDGVQNPLISLCAHGPFCSDCITTVLQHQVCAHGREFMSHATGGPCIAPGKDQMPVKAVRADGPGHFLIVAAVRAVKGCHALRQKRSQPQESLHDLDRNPR